MNYKHEYGRYKGKCERQEKEIADLNQEMEGWKQTVAASNAIIAAILEVTGSVTVKRERVSELVSKGEPMYCHVDAEEGTYTVGVEPEETAE